MLIETGQLNLNEVGTDPAYTSILGIPTLATGVFGGIIIGVTAAVMYNHYFNIELPSYLGFFAGKRFVPIFQLCSRFLLESSWYSFGQLYKRS